MNGCLAKRLTLFARICFNSWACSRTRRVYAAERLFKASLRGVDSHGILSMPIYAERIRSGQMKPGGTVRVLRESGATLFAMENTVLGPVLAMEIAERVVDKAEEGGLAAASLVNGNYVGAPSAVRGAYCRQGDAGHMCGKLHAARCSTWRKARGTWNEPTGLCRPFYGHKPLVFDAATGHSAARVGAAREQGVPLEDGILIDGEGLPSNDPEALDGGRYYRWEGRWDTGWGF